MAAVAQFNEHPHPLVLTYVQPSGMVTYKKDRFACKLCPKKGYFDIQQKKGGWVCLYEECNYAVHGECLKRFTEEFPKDVLRLLHIPASGTFSLVSSSSQLMSSLSSQSSSAVSQSSSARPPPSSQSMSSSSARPSPSSQSMSSFPSQSISYFP